MALPIQWENKLANGFLQYNVKWHAGGLYRSKGKAQREQLNWTLFEEGGKGHLNRGQRMSLPEKRRMGKRELQIEGTTYEK